MYLEYFIFGLFGSLTLAIPSPANPPKLLSRSISQDSNGRVYGSGQILSRRQEPTDRWARPEAHADSSFAKGTSGYCDKCVCELGKKDTCVRNCAFKCTKAPKCQQCTCDPEDTEKQLCDEDCRLCPSQGQDEANQRCDKCPMACADNNCPCFGYAVDNLTCSKYDYDTACDAYVNTFRAAIHAAAEKVTQCGSSPQSSLQSDTETQASVPESVPENGGLKPMIGDSGVESLSYNGGVEPLIGDGEYYRQ